MRVPELLIKSKEQKSKERPEEKNCGTDRDDEVAS